MLHKISNKKGYKGTKLLIFFQYLQEVTKIIKVVLGKRKRKGRKIRHIEIQICLTCKSFFKN